MSGVVLILTAADDDTADMVAAALADRGASTAAAVCDLGRRVVIMGAATA